MMRLILTAFLSSGQLFQIASKLKSAGLVFVATMSQLIFISGIKPQSEGNNLAPLYLTNDSNAVFLLYHLAVSFIKGFFFYF